ncbi:MAG: MaoC family dehydratase N-terminal domain-containing protein [Actinobacteria bacterium]|nr:MaoC family dehydratase N-terminal domain-containing protein [Actinomycetota bacterium]
MSAEAAGLDAEVAEWVGYTLDAGPGNIVCERGYILHWAESVEDANPLWWDETVAEQLTSGWIAPPSMLSVWMRPLMFRPDVPDGDEPIRPLEVHFRLKDALDLPEGVVTYNEIEFHEPVRPGDLISTRQTVSQISAPRTNRLGTGRYWRIDVTYTNQRGEVAGIETYNMFGYRRGPASQGSATNSDTRGQSGAPNHSSSQEVNAGGAAGPSLPELAVDVTARTVVMGASASRDWQPQHHDHAWAMAKQGTDIFLNTPNQAGWIERYVTDWTGPGGRLGKMRFRMKASIQPGHRMVFDGAVTGRHTDDIGCSWTDLRVTISVEDRIMTEAAVRVALPTDAEDNPWARSGDRWQPAAAGDLED